MDLVGGKTGAAVAAAVAAVAGLAWWTAKRAGAWTRIQWDATELPPRRVAFRAHRASYDRLRGPCLRIHADARAAAEATGTALPHEDDLVMAYFDAPDQVGPGQTRFAVGVSVHGNTALEEEMVRRGYDVVQIPAGVKALHTTFPFTGMLSILVAVSRVYPAAWVEFQRRGLTKMEDMGPVVEIAHERGQTTDFYFLTQPSRELAGVAAKAVSL